MSWKLFLDDERNPADVTWAPLGLQHNYRDGDWKIARTLLEVSKLITEYGMPVAVSFDHDLGDKQPTGHDIAMHMVQLDMDRERDLFGDVIEFAEDFVFFVHSKNPVGKANIIGYLNGYLEFKHGTKG